MTTEQLTKQLAELCEGHNWLTVCKALSKVFESSARGCLGYSQTNEEIWVSGDLFGELVTELRQIMENAESFASEMQLAIDEVVMERVS